MFFCHFLTDRRALTARSITRTENMAARPAPIAGIRQGVFLLQAHRNFVGAPGAGRNHTGLFASRRAPRILNRNHPGLHLHSHRFLPIPEHMFLSIKRISVCPSSSKRHSQGDFKEKEAGPVHTARVVTGGPRRPATAVICAAGVPAIDTFRATAGIIPNQ